MAKPRQPKQQVHNTPAPEVIPPQVSNTLAPEVTDREASLVPDQELPEEPSFTDYTMIGNLHNWFCVVEGQGYHYYRVGKPYRGNNNAIKIDTLLTTDDAVNSLQARSSVVDIIRVSKGTLMVAAYKKPYKSMTSIEVARSAPIRGMVAAPNAAKAYILNYKEFYAGVYTDPDKLPINPMGAPEVPPTQAPPAPPAKTAMDQILDQFIPMIGPLAAAITQRLTAAPVRMAGATPQAKQQAPAQPPVSNTQTTDATDASTLVGAGMDQITEDTAKVLQLLLEWDKADPDNYIPDLLSGIITLCRTNPTMYNMAVGFIKQAQQAADQAPAQ